MKVEATLSDLGEGVTEAYVAGILKNVGEKVLEGEDLIEVMTDKANVVLPAPATGVVIEVCYPLEARVSVGSVLAIIET